MADDERQDAPQDEPTPDRPEAQEPPAEQPEADAPAEQPEAEAPAEQPEAEAPAEQPEADEPVAEQPEAGDTPAEEPVAEAPAEAAEPEAESAEQPAAEERPRPKPKRDRKQDSADEPEVIPGAHLEPDLVLEDEAVRRGGEEDALAQYADVEAVDEAPVAESADAGDEEEAPGPVSAVFDLAADARYRATGKRKSAVARVTLRPGSGRYLINGKDLADYFPRATLQTQARRPLETVGQQDRMDVVAKIHGGGVSAQAGALRHGITRALVEADPNLRGELKRRGFLTRDPRVKERKKAGLKKARKRPQFSKR